VHIDIPSTDILPEIEKSVKEQFKDIVIPGIDKVVVERLEWTAEGIRLWIQS
jgi:hypothetical protein